MWVSDVLGGGVSKKPAELGFSLLKRLGTLAVCGAREFVRLGNAGGALRDGVGQHYIFS
jgi:hypothetical protein